MFFSKNPAGHTFQKTLMATLIFKIVVKPLNEIRG